MGSIANSNPIKKVSGEFVKWYEGVNGPGSSNGFAAFSYNATLVVRAAIERALKKAKPGTQEFRTAVRDEVLATKELIGTQGIYNFKTGTPYGVDERSVVLVRVDQGVWRLGAK